MLFSHIIRFIEMKIIVFNYIKTVDRSHQKGLNSISFKNLRFSFTMITGSVFCCNFKIVSLNNIFLISNIEQGMWWVQESWKYINITWYGDDNILVFWWRLQACFSCNVFYVNPQMITFVIRKYFALSTKIFILDFSRIIQH